MEVTLSPEEARLGLGEGPERMVGAVLWGRLAGRGGGLWSSTACSAPRGAITSVRSSSWR